VRGKLADRAHYRKTALDHACTGIRESIGEDNVLDPRESALLVMADHLAANAYRMIVKSTPEKMCLTRRRESTPKTR